MLLLKKDEIRKVFSMRDAIEADKECYKAFKAAYDAAPAGTYNFTFPELNIE